jgi:hypothetical protein
VRRERSENRGRARRERSEKRERGRDVQRIFTGKSLYMKV